MASASKKRKQAIRRKKKEEAKNKAHITLPQQARKETKESERLRKSSFPLLPKWSKSTIALVVGIPGLLASIYALMPKASISIGDRLDPNDALSTQIIVSNDSFYPLYNLSLSCTGGTVNYEGGGEVIIKPGVTLHTNGDEASSIGPGQKFTTVSFCHTPLGRPTSFDVVLRVEFKPFLFPLTHRDFRIVSVRTPDGKIATAQRPYP
ncbi:MAG: hypothetical protein ABSD59_13130 [Terracidiphilus sp.]|jgi:hypothetical protein